MNPTPETHWTDRLSEYLDGELNAAERQACESHLAGCADCARTLEDLRAVVARAAALPGDPPPAELWAGIEARLEAPVLQMRPRAALRERLSRRWSQSGMQLAAAAAVLVAATAAVVWWTTRVPSSGAPGTGTVATLPPADSATDPAPVPADSGVDTPAPAAPAGDGPRFATVPDDDRAAPAVAADFGVGRYDAAIAELETTLRSRRAQLDTSTVRIVENNLAIMDRAIADARQALAADPASRYLNSHLASTMRRKVDLLRRVNTLARI